MIQLGERVCEVFLLVLVYPWN